MKKSIYAMMAAVLALAGGMSVQAENMATPLQIVCVTADGNNLQQDEYADSLMVCSANTGFMGKEDYMASLLQIKPDRRGPWGLRPLQITPDRRGPWGMHPVQQILV